MLKVAAITGGRDLPSARFRIRQNIGLLVGHGICVTEYCPPLSQHARLPGRLGRIKLRYLAPIAALQTSVNAALRLPTIGRSYQADVTWIERRFVPGLEWLASLTRRPRVLDVDDALWLEGAMGGMGTAQLAARMDAVIAGNSYLAEWYSAHCRTVFVVPTGIDCERFSPSGDREGRRKGSPFTIGWTGISGNFRYLRMVEKPLARFLRDFPDAHLLIVANQRPDLPMIPSSKMSFIPWSPAAEASALHQMDVGIMPLADEEWAKGKCSFKMLQYMATALPVVVSRVGMNIDILKKGECGFGVCNDAEWYEALQVLYGSTALRARMGQTGRHIIEQEYSAGVVAARLADIFRSVA